MDTELKINTNTEGFRVHDTVVVQKVPRSETHSWRAYRHLGCVMSVNATELEYRLPNGETELYEPEKVDDEYYFTLSTGSEVEYMEQQKKELIRAEKAVETEKERLAAIHDWADTYENRISFFEKLGRFARAFGPKS